MIVDTSAVIAIVLREPEVESFVERIVSTERVEMSAASYLEAAIVIDSVRDPLLSRRFDQLVDLLGIHIVPVTPLHAEIARAAYRDFGRGSGHRAKLNYGDCFSYALATATRRPLLFKGDDFRHTDLVPA